MPVKVILPQFGESVVEGTITKWLKAEGDLVEEYQPLVEVNTDKVDTEVPSPVSGTLLKILVPEGVTAQAGTILAWIGAPDEAIPEGEGEYEVLTPSPEPAPVPSEAPLTPPVSVMPGRDQELGFISPVVARIASEHRVDLSRVAGTGQSGRITKRDLLAYLESQPEPTPIEAALPAEPEVSQPVPLTAPAAVPGELLRLSPVRRAIAEHMVFSKHTSPHVTTVMEADLSKVVAHRVANKSIFARDGVNLTFTAYFVSASVSTLKAFPVVNASWAEAGVQLHRDINIGMATSLGDEGLIVPVIKNADGFSLLGISRTVNDLAFRARAKKLQPEEVQGGTFTITNHGTSGSLFATPIINQPQCAILGVGVIQKRAVVIADAIAIRPMVYISLTFDHRILDGAIADYFLAKIVETLEKWPEGKS